MHNEAGSEHAAAAAATWRALLYLKPRERKQLLKSVGKERKRERGRNESRLRDSAAREAEGRARDPAVSPGCLVALGCLLLPNSGRACEVQRASGARPGLAGSSARPLGM